MNTNNLSEALTPSIPNTQSVSDSPNIMDVPNFSENPNAPTVLTGQYVPNAQNTPTITEKNYPITILWIFKAPIIILLVNLVALIFGLYFPYLVLALPIMLIANPLIRANFHYSLDDKYLHVKQGVISKKQRTIPYGIVQSVFVKQDLFDRIFGLATLRIENASQASDVKKTNWWSMSIGPKSKTSGQGDDLGASGNKINLPGLKKQSAEELKNLILQRMKDNPIDDSQSGL